MTAVGTLGILAACASLIVNGPKAWPVVKHAAHKTGCAIIKPWHKCAEPLKVP